MNLLDYAEDNKFVVIAELNPLRHTPEGLRYYSERELIKKVDILDGSVDYITVTESNRTTYRSNSLEACETIKRGRPEKNWPLIPHLTVRDHPRSQTGKLAMKLYAADMRDLLVIRGDDYTNGEGFYENSAEFVSDLKRRREYIFNIGVAGHPERPAEWEVPDMRRKVDAGARFAITQAVWSSYEVSNYIKMLKDNGINIPVFAGLIPVKSQKVAENIEMFAPGVKVPDELKQKLEGASPEKAREVCIEDVRDILKNIRTYTSAAGVDVFCRGDAQLVKEILKGI